MRSFTFSLTSLLGVMTLLSLDFGAIVADVRLLTSAAYTLFLGLLCFAAAASLVAPAERRPYWIGFALFGLAYWLVVFESPGASSRSQYTYGGLGGFAIYGGYTPEPPAAKFLTDDLLEFIEERLVQRREVGSHVLSRWMGGGFYWGTILEIDDGRYLIKWDDGSTPTWQTWGDVAATSSNRRVALHVTVGTVWSLLGGAIVALWVGRVTRKPHAAASAGTSTSSTSIASDTGRENAPR